MSRPPLLHRTPTLLAHPASAPEIDEFRSRARSWLQEHAPGPVPSDDLDARFRTLRAWQRTLYDAGWVGIGLPREWGGQGLDDRYAYVFTEELARAGRPAPIGLIGLDVVGPTLAGHGTAAQRAALMPALLSGDEIWCQGFSEPGAGSDLAAIATRAVLADGVYKVSGQKVWTSWAQYARRCALLARTGTPDSRHRGLTYLIVDMDAPGVTVRPIGQMTGDSEFCEVFFDDVEVPVTDVIGEPGQGWAIAMDTLSHERATYAFRRRVETTAAFRAATEVLHDSATRAAGELAAPMQPSEALVAGLGRAETALAVLEAQNLATLRRMTSDGGPSPADSVDKLVVNHCEQTVFGELHAWVTPGGAAMDAQIRGLDTGAAVRGYLFSRAASIYGGTNQVQRNIVAQRGLGMGGS